MFSSCLTISSMELSIPSFVHSVSFVAPPDEARVFQARLQSALPNASRLRVHAIPEASALRQTSNVVVVYADAATNASQEKILKNTCHTITALRSHSASPSVLAITPDSRPQMRRRLFDCGASDVLITPFETPELVVRIARVARAAQPLRLGQWRLDMDSKTLHHLRTDAVCHLPPAEAALLHMLLLGNGRIVDFETLSCAISPEHDGAGIRTRISSLRKRLSKLEGARCVIEAVRNHGYRIVL